MPKDKNPTEELKLILASMGKTGEDVAACLRVNNCRGFMLGKGSPDPLTRYIYRKFDDGQISIHITGRLKWGTLVLHRTDRAREEIPLPSPVSEFLELFEEGEFPDLELKDRSTH